MYFDPGGGESRLDVNVRGFAAEIAAARATGLPLNEELLDVTTYRREDKPSDIGRRTEVRSTRSPMGPLYVYEGDPVRDRLALLVTGARRVFTIVGWISMRDAKDKNRWCTDLRYPAFVTEQYDLRPLPMPEDG